MAIIDLLLKTGQVKQVADYILEYTKKRIKKVEPLEEQYELMFFRLAYYSNH